MLKMVDGTGIIGVDMVCPLGGTVSPPQPPNYDNVEMEGVGSLMLPNSLKAPLERLELIGNSVQGENPAPDNPQEIKSAGRKSRNLFDITKLPLNHDGTKFVIPETALNTFIFEEHQFEENTQYTLSAQKVTSKNEQSAIIRFYYTDGTRSEINVKNLETKSLTSISGKTVDYLLIGNPYKAEHEVFGLQLEKGTTATDYEPYGYLLDVKVTGKNLFNLTDNYIWGWFAGYQTQISLYSVNAVVYMPCKPNTTYTIYGRTNINGNNNVKNRVATANDFPAGGTKLHNITETQLSNPVTITTDELSKYLVIMAVTDNECDMSTREQVLKKNVSKMMVIIGNAPTSYEPYTEQTVQIALDEPLRGIGEYKDMLTKDGVVRRILEAPLVKYLKPVINGNVGNRYVFAEVPNANINYDRERCMSNVGFTNSTEKKKYIPHPYQLNFLIRVADDDTIEMVKEKIKDIIVAYTAKEPITEPLPESVQQQLQALHSENGVTHIFVDSGEVPCGIKLTYRKEK
ncbi:hypothetical protein [Faecalimonas umbilicata]|uniref:hypothetical protein n=1 Tax=Faecalimonas umbilicata TaxID=1912855 RepID=UPI0022E222F2|nr:hypothetical protein [Faecalimonas umbilicata]